jgi:hypothetical protein
MMRDLVNGVSHLLLGVRVVDLSEKKSQSKILFQKAERLAQYKQLRDAIITAEKIMVLWYPCHSISEQIGHKIWVGSFLEEVKYKLNGWNQRLDEAENLTASANYILEKETVKLPSSKALNAALKLYQESYFKHEEAQVKLAIERCQHLLRWREKYELLVSEAEKLAKQRSVKQAIARYQKAQQLFATDQVEAAITQLSTQVHQERTFEATLRQAERLSGEGKFHEAIALLDPALAQFERADGRNLLSELQKAVLGIEHFEAGYNFEQSGDFVRAFSNYQSAQTWLPHILDCTIRKASVAVKLQQWDEAIFILDKMGGDSAAYIRGFAHAKKGNWQQANREWQSISDLRIHEQRQLLGILVERDRLVALQQIEKSVDAENLGLAHVLSSEFMKKFGQHELVLTNLENHIQPRLETAFWQEQSSQKIADFAEKKWRDRLDIASLHNWAIAAYYHAKVDPNKLVDCIISWSTAIANLHLDPSLKNLPWLENSGVDLQAVRSDIHKKLEDAIESIKDKNPNDYLRFRDLYRREMVALRLMGTPPKSGAKQNNLFLTPGCWMRCLSSLSTLRLTDKILQALYTKWGLAVAACIEGDTARAIQLKPAIGSVVEGEQFAQQLVSYHEGCYHLQQKQWRNAISPLKQARQEIKANPEWRKEIDRLCQQQRLAISEFNDHLYFAQSWYDILDSQSARSYLAEYKSEQIREQLVAKTIQEYTALVELQRIKQIDFTNPVVLDLIERIEITQDARKVEELMKANKLEQAVQEAKRSRHQQVRNNLTQFFLKVFIEGFQKSELGFADIAKIGELAHELSPEDTNVEELYKVSLEFKKVHNLMQCDQFPEAVSYASDYGCETLKTYMAEFFILLLIKGLENQQIPVEVARRFAGWAYVLRPNQLEYQRIYRDFGIIRNF